MTEPWPVEVYDHGNRLHEILMEPGDVVYYESAKNLHGRNRPLAGKGKKKNERKKEKGKIERVTLPSGYTLAYTFVSYSLLFAPLCLLLLLLIIIRRILCESIYTL